MTALTFPARPVEGDLFFDDATRSVYTFDRGVWLLVERPPPPPNPPPPAYWVGQGTPKRITPPRCAYCNSPQAQSSQRCINCGAPQ